MDIYPAGEAPIPGVHARDLAGCIAAHGHWGDVGQLGAELLTRLGDMRDQSKRRY